MFVQVRLVILLAFVRLLLGRLAGAGHRFASEHEHSSTRTFKETKNTGDPVPGGKEQLTAEHTIQYTLLLQSTHHTWEKGRTGEQDPVGARRLN